MPVLSYTAAQWQARARRTREIIEKLADPSARNAMVMLARAYERLASEAALGEPHSLAPGRAADSAIH